MISLYHSVYKREDIYLLRIAIDEGLEYLEDLEDRGDYKNVRKSIAYKELTKFYDYLLNISAKK